MSLKIITTAKTVFNDKVEYCCDAFKAVSSFGLLEVKICDHKLDRVYLDLTGARTHSVEVYYCPFCGQKLIGE